MWFENKFKYHLAAFCLGRKSFGWNKKRQYLCEIRLRKQCNKVNVRLNQVALCMVLVDFYTNIYAFMRVFVRVFRPETRLAPIAVITWHDCSTEFFRIGHIDVKEELQNRVGYNLSHSLTQTSGPVSFLPVRSDVFILLK